MSLDTAESIANAVLGLLVSIAAVAVLRASGAWVTAPAWVIAGLFFVLSVARARALRAVFRMLDRG